MCVIVKNLPQGMLLHNFNLILMKMHSFEFEHLAVCTLKYYETNSMCHNDVKLNVF